VTQADRAQDAERGFTNGGPGWGSGVGDSSGSSQEQYPARRKERRRSHQCTRRGGLPPTRTLHFNSGMRGPVLVAAIGAGAVAWFALVVAAPHLPAALAAAVYAVGALVCHQRPERSFHWDGVQLAVCARCTGIYLGACATAVLACVPPRHYVPRVTAGRRVRVWLAAAALPTAVTVASEWAGWWVPSAHMRAATGVVLGAAAGLVVAAALHYERCQLRAADGRQPPTPI